MNRQFDRHVDAVKRAFGNNGHTHYGTTPAIWTAPFSQPRDFRRVIREPVLTETHRSLGLYHRLRLCTDGESRRYRRRIQRSSRPPTAVAAESIARADQP